MDEIFLQSDNLQGYVSNIKKFTNQINDVQVEINKCINQFYNSDMSEALRDIVSEMLKNYDDGKKILEEITNIESIIKGAVITFNELDTSLAKDIENSRAESKKSGVFWQKESLAVKMDIKSDFQEIDKNELNIKKDMFKRDIPEAFTKKLENFFEEPKTQAMLTLLGSEALAAYGLLEAKKTDNIINSRDEREVLKYKIYNFNKNGVHAEETNLDQHELNLSNIGMRLRKVNDLAKSGAQYQVNKILGNTDFVDDVLNIKDNYVYSNGAIKNGDSSGIKEAINFSRNYIKLTRGGVENSIADIMNNVGDYDIKSNIKSFFSNDSSK
ncbi:hypothetical protein [Clostridium felsineum]|uniref:Uncharacterized protein n=1 Tax=Clostridium felsineum TaxID=36839 RepID=A0A1S8L9Z9_9CLOT|nr:hypothetical protein [Clostridium felsineum]URZ05000.1 hypothetical protein CLROS_003240 [Clostridium felsineum]URZ10041.1 hypothetical protein CROST_007490 [Clostridium felsineum]